MALYHNLPSGGGLFHFSEVVRALKEAGHQLHLFTPSTAETEFCDFRELLNDHTTYPRAPFKSSSKWTRPFAYVLYLRKMILEEKAIAADILAKNFDGVYMGQCQLWTEPPLLSHLKNKVPSLLYCQEPKRSFYEESFLEKRKSWSLKKMWRLPTIEWMKKIQKKNILAASVVFCNSKFSNKNIKKAYGKINAEVQYIGVDTDYFCPKPSLKREKKLLSIGAIDPSKNHQMAIELASLKPGGQNFSVQIIGDRSYGSTANELKKLAEKKGVLLEIFEKTSREFLLEAIQSSYALVYCPLKEPFGIVAIEAQACETPVLGLAEGGLLETMPLGLSGGVLHPKEAKSLAKTLELWLTQPEEYLKVSRRGREHVLKNWHHKILLQKTLQRIEQAFSPTH